MQALLDSDDDATARSHRIAELFRFVHRHQFEHVARSLPLRQGVVAWVNRMRRAGFMVGIVSESYFVAAEVMRRRVFADFALAHTLQFRNEVCTGELRLNPAFGPIDASPGAVPCKSNVLRRLLADDAQPDWRPFTMSWAAGDDLHDLELLRTADRAFIVEPKSPRLRHVPGAVEFADFAELAALVKREGWLELADADESSCAGVGSPSPAACAAAPSAKRPPCPEAA